PAASGSASFSPSSAAFDGRVPPAVGAADAGLPLFALAALAASGAAPPDTYAEPFDRFNSTGVPAPPKNTVPPPVPASAEVPPERLFPPISPGPCGVSNQNSSVDDGDDDPASPAARVTQNPSTAWADAGESAHPTTTPIPTHHAGNRRIRRPP